MVPNFYTKINLLEHLLEDEELMCKVLVFAESKKLADRLEERLNEKFPDEIGVIHSNKSQNFRLNSIKRFDRGTNRILIATDLISRGIDFEDVSHVVNFDTPAFAENYLHRIGRTGRAEAKGTAITFVNKAEEDYFEAIETLMNYEIPRFGIPDEVEISDIFTPEEQPNLADKNYLPEASRTGVNSGFQKKKEKNLKTNQGGSYKREIKAKYKKPKTRGAKPNGRGWNSKTR
jgi:ATP-dependent RNA helicase RhlE